MKTASIVYLLCGLAYLGIVAVGTIQKGIQWPGLFLAIVGCAFLMQAYFLYQRRPHIRVVTIIVSCLIFTASAIIAFPLLESPRWAAASVAEMPSDAKRVLGAAISVGLAHAYVAAALAVNKWRFPGEPIGKPE